MENKKLDNEILNTKSQIDKIDNLIDNEKSRIKKLDSMQEDIMSISKSINQCIELLSQSIKGPNTESKYNDMRNSNKKAYINIATFLDNEVELSRKKINKLYDEKETLLKKSKNKEE